MRYDGSRGKPTKAGETMKKYKQGDLIRSLDELMAQEFIMMRGKVYHFGWFNSWPVRSCKWYLDRGLLFRVEMNRVGETI